MFTPRCMKFVCFSFSPFPSTNMRQGRISPSTWALGQSPCRQNTWLCWACSSRSHSLPPHSLLNFLHTSHPTSCYSIISYNHFLFLDLLVVISINLFTTSSPGETLRPIQSADVPEEEAVHESSGNVDFSLFVRALDVFCTSNSKQKKIESEHFPLPFLPYSPLTI